MLFILNEWLFTGAPRCIGARTAGALSNAQRRRAYQKEYVVGWGVFRKLACPFVMILSFETNSIFRGQAKPWLQIAGVKEGGMVLLRPHVSHHPLTCEGGGRMRLAPESFTRVSDASKNQDRHQARPGVCCASVVDFCAGRRWYQRCQALGRA